MAQTLICSKILDFEDYCTDAKIALIFAMIFIFIRSCFRVVELSGGFGSALANNQITFMVLESAMIVSACLCLTLIHPGKAFEGGWKDAEYRFHDGIGAGITKLGGSLLEKFTGRNFLHVCR
jgi:hypothetical protein